MNQANQSRVKRGKAGPSPVELGPVEHVTATRPVLRWTAVVGWMGLIFALSAQSGSESAGLSGQVAHAAASLLQRTGLEPDLEVLGVLVRKGAHVTEYAILGGLLTWAWRAWPARMRPEPTWPDRTRPEQARPGHTGRRHREQGRWSAFAGPAVLGVLYAATDEFHQVFVPGRAGQVSDVAIDAIGVLLGVLLTTLLSNKRHPRAQRARS